MPEIEFHVAAAEELRAAAAYYEVRQSGLGEAFLSDIEQGLLRIQQFSELWPVLEPEYRRYCLQRFPFGIIYTVAPTAIYVVAVAHLSRRPDYWRERE